MTQAQRLLELLSDGRAHRTDEIMRVVYGSDHLGIARISARVWDLNDRFKKQGRPERIVSEKDPEHPTLYFYRLVGSRRIVLPPARPEPVAPDRVQARLIT